MAVRLVREEDPQAPQAPPPLRLAPVPEEPPVVAPAPQSPPPPAPEPPAPDLRQAVTIQALAVTIALANVISIRLALILTITFAAGLTLFAEAQREYRVEAVVAAALFTIFGLIPMVALALRKG